MRRICLERAGMKRPAALLILTFLMAPAAVPASGAQETGLPRWAVGDCWKYEIITESPQENVRGNLTVVVTGEGRVRIGNATHSVYVLSLTRKELGARYTKSSISKTYVSKKSLCTLYSKSSLEVSFGSLRSTGELTLTYSPSDGRYLFPLALNRSWSADYNLTRVEVSEGARRAANISISSSHTCSWVGNITVGKASYTAYLINQTMEGSGNYTRYWYSERVRGEVRVEEYNEATGSMTTLVLKKYSRAPGTEPLFGPDTGRIITLVAIALALLGAAAALGLAPRLRRRA